MQLSQIFILFLIYSLFLNPIPTLSAENLVANPDFIDLQQGWRLIVSSGAANWEVSKKGGVGDDMEVAFIEVIALPDPWWHIYLTQSNIPLEKGINYTYSVWAKTTQGEDKDITLKVQKGADPWTAYITKSFTINDQWDEYWVSWSQFETEASGQIIVFVGSAQRLDKNDKLWLDHFRVYEGAYKKDELSQQSITPAVKFPILWGMIKLSP